MCGETEIAAADLTTVIDNLKEMTDEGVTGFQKQLQVYMLLHEICNAHVMLLFHSPDH